MPFKIIAGIVALALALAYLLPPVFKLKDTALGVVIVFGLVLMALDVVQSLRSKDD